MHWLWVKKIAPLLCVPISRRFLWMVVAFGFGIALYFYQSTEPKKIPMLLLGAGLLILFLINQFSWKTLRIALVQRRFIAQDFFYGRRFLSIALCIMVGCGYLAAFYRTHSVGTFMMDEFYKDLRITGEIIHVEERYPYVLDATSDAIKNDAMSKAPYVRLTIAPLEIVGERYSGDALSSVKKVRLKCEKSLFPKDRELAPGDRLTVICALSPFKGAIYPGGLNMRQHAYFEGISAQGRVKKIIDVQVSPTWSITQYVRHVRHHLTHSIVKALGNQTGSIAAALITGDRSFITPQTRQDFVDAGIAHILAISGLHLSIIAGFVFFVIRGSLALSPYLAENFPIKKIAAVWVVILTFLYLLISGAGYPVQRAFCMIMLAMGAILVGRQGMSMRLLAFAALVILLMTPESLISASFQLSFAAVTALIAFYETGWRALEIWSRYGHWLQRAIAYGVGVLCSTLIATLATTPFTIAFFNRFTLQAIVGNMLSIPLTSFVIMPLAFINVMALSFGGVDILWKAFGFSLDLLSRIAFFTAHLPGAIFRMSSPPTWAFLSILFGGLFVCLWHNSLRLIGLLPIMIGMIGFAYAPIPHMLMTRDIIAFPKGDVLFVSNNKKWFEKNLWQKHLGLSSTRLLNDHSIREKTTCFWGQPKEIPYKKLMQQCDDASITTYITTGYVPKPCKQKILARGGILFDRYALKNKVWMQWSVDAPLIPLLGDEKRPWG